jgi:hypothetical protein
MAAEVTVAGAGVLVVPVEVVDEAAFAGDEAQPETPTAAARPRRAARKTEQFFMERQV